jgi:hypothetical protein
VAHPSRRWSVERIDTSDVPAPVVAEQAVRTAAMSNESAGQGGLRRPHGRATQSARPSRAPATGRVRFELHGDAVRGRLAQRGYLRHASGGHDTIGAHRPSEWVRRLAGAIESTIQPGWRPRGAPYYVARQGTSSAGSVNGRTLSIARDVPQDAVDLRTDPSRVEQLPA